MFRVGTSADTKLVSDCLNSEAWQLKEKQGGAANGHSFFGGHGSALNVIVMMVA